MPLILCDDNGAFIRFFEFVGGVVTSTDLDLDGNPYVPVGAVVDCGSVEADVEQRMFCDDNGGILTPYLVAYEYDETGAIVGSTTTTIDGTTPYVPTGTTLVCASEEGGIEAFILCDDTTPFKRKYRYNAVGTVLSVTDTTLDGTTPYVVAGTVGICPSTTADNMFNADNLVPTAPGVALDEQLTVDNTAGGVQFATVFHADTTHVVWSVEPGGIILATFDGSAPTSTSNHTLYPRDRDVWTVETAQAAKFIRGTTTNGIIAISQMKPRV